jgi:polyprenyldihydroxybenzoate methyltransferase / 3-demethylubiquinol 3-O-methyltransferase
VVVQPGGHLFLSTIARTPLSYVLTILMAEYILRQVTPGTHTHSKFVNPSELVSFFQDYPPPKESEPSGPAPVSPPWITRTDERGRPRRTEAEVREMEYVPWKAQWILKSRAASAWGATACNYLFWVRKPSLPK